MIALPGPSVLLTVGHSIAFGWRPALLTVAGATAGIAVQLLVAAIGLTSLLETTAAVFTYVRWAGAAYLVYLGIQQWRSSDALPDLESLRTSRTNLFVQGLLVTVPNPKSLVFIAAFLPQFVETARPIGVQLAYIIPTFLIITFGVTALWAIAAGKARTTLQKRNIAGPAMRTGGGLMILAGLGMALARRGN